MSNSTMTRRFKLVIQTPKGEIPLFRNCLSWRGAARWKANQLAKHPDWTGYTITDVQLLTHAVRAGYRP